MKEQIINISNEAINELLDLKIELNMLKLEDRKAEFKKIKAEKRTAKLVSSHILLVD